MKARFVISIRTILLTGFCGLSAVGIAVALFLGLSTAFHNTRDLVSDNIEALVDRLASEVEGRMKPVERRSRWIAGQIASGQVDISLPISDETDFFFQTVLAATPGAGAIAIITKDAKFRGWSRNQAERLREDWSDDPEVLAWIARGETDPLNDWGPPIWIESLQSAGVIYETSLIVDGEFIGYLTYAIPVSDFSRFLSTIDTNAFILFGRNDVLAHPLMINWRPVDEETLPTPSAIYNEGSALIPISELGDPVLEELWNAEPIDFSVRRSQNNQDFRAAFAEIADREFVYLYRTLEGYGPKPLIIGTHLDADQAGEVFDRLSFAAAGGGFVIIVAVVFGLFVARAIARPVRALASAAATVESGKLDQVPDLPLSHVSELNSAVTSFEAMVKGLVEKDVIRHTLGRYVPESIAEQLMQGDGDLRPTEAEASVLFSDIAGFTALTEALGPNRIVEVLNAYFSRMTEIIEAEGGVITQFQGDAILAVFNVPIEAPDHAERACRVAVRMRDSVERETFAGEKLTSRIGVNTGPIVAGAVGAQGRLTYTVHGDAVNRAARVEGMNKETGTTILITEATARSVSSIPMKPVGDMAVRGQSDPVRVFTPGAED